MCIEFDVMSYPLIAYKSVRKKNTPCFFLFTLCRVERDVYIFRFSDFFPREIYCVCTASYLICNWNRIKAIFIFILSRSIFLFLSMWLTSQFAIRDRDRDSHWLHSIHICHLIFQLHSYTHTLRNHRWL